ncbi:hypothetical protein KBK19_05420 [Microvirga sp. STR05]|uniref:Secreted protein n=1 Tax=Hymenobacter duratus TaxID=2771356 RepID=A0ABR8JCF2_9BACT|nr:hypothetical protein [Hymenobacter duratus]MBD2714465.1 hypothetical protein [Hymenobacter duratus]MBR7949369.1 hypothetical protein [Microvirga sp. STR05]
MLRSALIWLLLLNYLLVVGAGLVGRPEPVPQRATAYVHSADCQQKHYLQIDCFDHCNGEQYATRKPGASETPLHFLSTLKGLDVHCLTAADLVPVAVVIYAPKPQAPRLRPAEPAGFGQTLYAPPRHC